MSRPRLGCSQFAMKRTANTKHNMNGWTEETWKKFQTYYENQGRYAMALAPRIVQPLFEFHPDALLQKQLEHQFEETVTQFDL